MRLIKAFLNFLVVIAVLWGCAGTGKDPSSADYNKMPDEDLLKYYYELAEKVKMCESKSGIVRVGIGTGMGGPGSGVGIGASAPVSGSNSGELKRRLDEVEAEINKRGLNTEQ